MSRQCSMTDNTSQIRPLLLCTDVWRDIRCLRCGQIAEDLPVSLVCESQCAQSSHTCMHARSFTALAHAEMEGRRVLVQSYPSATEPIIFCFHLLTSLTNICGMRWSPHWLFKIAIDTTASTGRATPGGANSPLGVATRTQRSDSQRAVSACSSSVTESHLEGSGLGPR